MGTFKMSPLHEHVRVSSTVPRLPDFTSMDNRDTNL